MTDTGQRLTAMLWERAAPPKRGPRRTLTLDAIGRIGIAIADAEGLGAVTMQRVAEGLGVTKMALYRYVPGKAELVALMIDIGVGPPPVKRSRARAWRSATVAWARALFEIFLQHPWCFPATVGPRVLGPNELAWLEHAVGVLDDTPLRGAEKLDVVTTVVGHVRNVAQQLSAGRTGTAERAAPPKLLSLLRGREDDFPALHDALTSVGESGGRGQALDFGLSRVLDGVAALIDARTEAAALRSRSRRRPRA